MIKKKRIDFSRTLEQITHHYNTERELSDRLRESNHEDRLQLYGKLYNELYQRVPDHSQLISKKTDEIQSKSVARKFRLVKQFIEADTTFLEIGAGDCSLAIEVAHSVKKVYAIDVSDEITKKINPPNNLQLIISNGCNIPVPAGCIDVAYSYQVMEHLHPEDAHLQLQNIYDVLSPEGIYICVTPNRLSGPHDISKHFDDHATGFHLKEYTTNELTNLFKKVGFKGVRVIIGSHRGIYLPRPISTTSIRVLEKLLMTIPIKLRRRIARFLPIRVLLGIFLIGNKGEKLGRW